MRRGMDPAQEEQNHIIQNARALGYTNIRVIGHNSDGSEVIALHQPRRRGPPGRIWGTLVVNFTHYTEEPHRDHPDLEERIQHQTVVIELLIRQFGRDRKAVVRNEGPEYVEFLRNYHPYTLQECLERVDYKLRFLYIHQLYREEGESFCQRHLTQNLWRIEGLRLSSWVDNYDLLQIMCQAWAQRQEPVVLRDVNPGGWGRWRGGHPQGNREPSPAPADEETSEYLT